MTSTTLTTARPSYAAIAWATKDAIFVEIPCRDGPPYIARYPRTLEGLTSALNVICDRPEIETRTIARTHPAIRKVGLQVTNEQRNQARDVMRRLGLI